MARKNFSGLGGVGTSLLEQSAREPEKNEQNFPYLLLICMRIKAIGDFFLTISTGTTGA